MPLWAAWQLQRQRGLNLVIFHTQRARGRERERERRERRRERRKRAKEIILCLGNCAVTTATIHTATVRRCVRCVVVLLLSAVSLLLNRLMLGVLMFIFVSISRIVSKNQIRIITYHMIRDSLCVNLLLMLTLVHLSSVRMTDFLTQFCRHTHKLCPKRMQSS